MPQGLMQMLPQLIGLGTQTGLGIYGAVSGHPSAPLGGMGNLGGNMGGQLIQNLMQQAQQRAVTANIPQQQILQPASLLSNASGPAPDFSQLLPQMPSIDFSQFSQTPSLAGGGSQ